MPCVPARPAGRAPAGRRWRHEETESFLDWAAHYEDGTREGRNLARHEAWLATLSYPLLRLDGTRPPAALAERIAAALDERDAEGGPPV